MSVSPSEFFYADVSYVDTSNALINFSNLTGNAELNEHPLSKYARGIFFSPNYNKQFFDAINWANNLGIYKTQLNLINPFNNSILENLFSNIPSAYPEGMIAYYVADDIIIENNSWPDRSGNNNATLVGTGFSISTDGLALKGTTSSSILFGNILNTEYTICSITSYSGTNNKTILNSADANWIHGHYNGRSGVIAYELDGGITPTVALDLTSSASVMTNYGATFSAEGMHQTQENYALATPFAFGTPFTIVTRVKWNIIAEYNYIIELKDNNGSNTIRLGPWSNNKIHYGENEGGWINIQGDTILVTNTWYDIRVTHSGSEVKIYVNDNEYATGTANSCSLITRDKHYISSPHANAAYQHGESTVQYINYYNDVYPPNASQQLVSLTPFKSLPDTYVHTIPASPELSHDQLKAQPQKYTINPTGWNGFSTTNDWSILISSNGVAEMLMRWGDSWGTPISYIVDNFNSPPAPAELSFTWRPPGASGLSIGIESPQVNGNVVPFSFVIAFDSSLYQSDSNNLTSITTGVQGDGAAIKLYRKVENGEWERPDIKSFSYNNNLTEADYNQFTSTPMVIPYYNASWANNGTGDIRIDEFNLYNDVWTPPAPPAPVVHPPEPPSITLIGSIDTPIPIGVNISWAAAPELFNAATTATWDGLKPDKDWSIVVKTDARVKFIMRWGADYNSWANESMYISDNYGWNAGAPGHVTFYWKNVIAISVMGIPGDESARAHINSISFAVSYDSALYQSDPANVTSITIGPQNENAAIKLYIIIGDGEWVLANISHVYHYGTPVDSRPSPPGYLKGPYTSSSYYGHAYGTASQIDEAELYNGIWKPAAPSTSSTSSIPIESFSVTFDGDVLGAVDSNTVLYQPKGQVWQTNGIGPYRYNKSLIDTYITGNYVASTWIGATLSDGNIVATVITTRMRVWMIIIEGQESQVDLVGWNLVNNDKHFLFRDTTNTQYKFPYLTPLYNRIFEANTTTYLDNSIALFLFEPYPFPWTVTCGTNAIASDGTQSILVNGNNITPVSEQEFPYNDYVYKIDNTIEGISVNVPGSELGGWAGSLEKDCGIYFKVETNSSSWQGNILGLLTHNPTGAYGVPIMQSWLQTDALFFLITHASGHGISTYVPFTISPSTVYEIYITWHAMSSSHPTAPDLNDIVIGFRESGGNWVNRTANDGNNTTDTLELSNNENFSVENNIATSVIGINGNGDINSNGGNPGTKVIDFRLYNKYLDHNESAPASVYGSDGNISVNINNGNSSDFSDFAIKELIVWPRALTSDEMKSVSDYMIANLNSPVF